MVGLGGVAGCGPDEARHQRALAEQAERAERAAAHAKAELDADQARYKKMSTSLADPRALNPAPVETAPANDPVAETPPPSSPVVASPGEQVSRPSEAVKQLQKTIAALEAIEAAGIECNNILRTYAQPDKRQIAQCQKFMDRTAPGSEWTRTVETLNGLARNEQLARDNDASFVKARRLTETVQHYNDFAWSRMRTITGQAKP